MARVCRKRKLGSQSKNAMICSILDCRRTIANHREGLANYKYFLMGLKRQPEALNDQLLSDQIDKDIKFTADLIRETNNLSVELDRISALVTRAHEEQ